jgi:hypothetical protein
VLALTPLLPVLLFFAPVPTLCELSLCPPFATAVVGGHSTFGLVLDVEGLLHAARQSEFQELEQLKYPVVSETLSLQHPRLVCLHQPKVGQELEVQALQVHVLKL